MEKSTAGNNAINNSSQAQTNTELAGECLSFAHDFLPSKDSIFCTTCLLLMTQIQCQHLGKRDLNETKLLIKRTVSHLLLPLMMQTVSLSGLPKICQETKDFILEGASTEIPKLHKYISCNTYKYTKICIRSNFLFQCLLKMMFNHSSSLENCSELGWRNKWQTMAVGRKINGIPYFHCNQCHKLQNCSSAFKEIML